MVGTEIERLIQILAKLPGLGPRSARRLALMLLKKPESLLKPLADALNSAAAAIKLCSICGNVDTVDPCTICTDPRRDRSVICVVEEIGDLWALERTGAFRGTYHVLGGTLSAFDGVGPEDLRIPELTGRVERLGVGEVILATNATIDGQTTAHYIAEQLASDHVTLSGLAHGVPVGGELDYLDDGTLTTALSARRKI